VSAERRIEPRRKVLKRARISTHHLGTSIDCTVRNLSDSGALLLVTSSVGVPDEFDLVFDDRSVKRCRVVRRSIDKVGVAFT
jgi:hypothetical protein